MVGAFELVRLSYWVFFQLLCCSMLAEKLNMTPDEAERWIVNLIRNARLDAKIDSKLVCNVAHTYLSTL